MGVAKAGVVAPGAPTVAQPPGPPTAVFAAAAPGPTGGPLRGNRTPIIVAIVAGSIALIMVVVLVVVLTSSGGDPKPEPRVQQTVSTDASTTTTAPVAAPPELENVVRQLDAQLSTSAIGRQMLTHQLLDPYNNCTISQSEASTIIDQVIQNRQGVLTGLNGIATTDATAQNLVALLRQAIQASLDSNYQWKQWIDNQSSFGCPIKDASEESAESISNNRATPAKQAFVEAYNPVAQQYGLAVKTAADF